MEPPTGPFPAYHGPEPYAYVCHASADAYRVYEIIRELHLAGFRIWYFEDGMKADPSWPDQNARAIDNCTAFIIFTSAVSVDRPDTMDELTRAHNANKPILQIQLEQLTLPPGMGLFLDRPQALKTWRKDQATIIDEAAQFLRTQGLQPSPHPPEIPPPAPPPAPRIKMPPRPSGGQHVSISDTFANRVDESELLAAAVAKQLARLYGDEDIEEDVFPNVLVFHGRSGLGKTGLSRRLEMWATGKPLEHNEWGTWPHAPITPVRWDFNNSAGGVRLDTLLVILREALADAGMVPMAFDLALVSYLEAVRPGSDATGLLSGRAADAVFRSLQRMASELRLSVPGALTASEVRRLRDGVIAASDRGSLERYEHLPNLLEDLRQLSQGTQDPKLAANVMYVLTQEIVYADQPPVLVFFLDAFERLQRQESRFAESGVAEPAITALIAAMPYGLFVVSGQDALDWHEVNRTYLPHCGPRAWPGLASGAQHMLERLSDEDTRRLYETHRDINRWHMSDELVDQLTKRSDGLPIHIELVMQLAQTLEEQKPGRTMGADELDHELPELVTRLMETLSERERNAFRAMCVLPFFDKELAAAVMAEQGLDREGAVDGAIRHALVESNPGSVYPYRIHDEIRKEVRRDRRSPGFWGDGDWKEAAQRGLDEAKRRIERLHRLAETEAEMEAMALAIRLAFDWDLPVDGLPKLITDGPTIGGLAPLLPVLPDPPPKSAAAGLVRFVTAHAMSVAPSIVAFETLYREYADQPEIAGVAGRFYAYRLRNLGRRDEALRVFLSMLDAQLGDPELLHKQVTITLRGGRRFKDALEYVHTFQPDRLGHETEVIERVHGIIRIEELGKKLGTVSSSRLDLENVASYLLNRSYLGPVPLAETQTMLTEATVRRSLDGMTTGLLLLGLHNLANPPVLADIIERLEATIDDYGSSGQSLVALLCIKALMTRDPADAARAQAHALASPVKTRGSTWIKDEVWLEELGYRLPPVPTQWIIPYEQVRENWLNIANGIIERAKARADDHSSHEAQLSFT